MIELSACPVCKEKDLVKYLAVKDYTQSQETFQLEKCAACGFVMTNPRPDDHSLPAYYESEKYISHADRASGILDRVYNISRLFTMRWKYNVVRQHSKPPTASILDFGCGTGVFLQECEKHNLNTTGVEPSLRARTHATNHTRAAIYASLTELPEGSFDAITAWHVLEHVSDFHETLRSLKERLNPDGRLFIAVPNLQSYDAQKYGAFWAGYDVPRHLWHFSKSTMTSAVQQHGLKLITSLPMKLDAYYVSLLSEQYKNGSSGVTTLSRAAATAWKSNQAAKTTGHYSSIIYILGQ